MSDNLYQKILKTLSSFTELTFKQEKANILYRSKDAHEKTTCFDTDVVTGMTDEMVLNEKRIKNRILRG